MSAKVLPLFDRKSAQAQAQQWIARMDAGALSPAERVQLQEWLAQDERHGQLLDAHALLWSTASKARFGSAAEGVTPKPLGVSTRARQWFAPTVGACAALMVALGMWVLPADDWPQETAQVRTHSTAIGERRSVALSDGSSMHLNTNTEVQVNFGPHRRRIVLQTGEGYFEVAKDAARPFEVRVGSTVVRAIGTRFLVRRQASGQAEVTVFEGVVELLKAADESVESGDGRAKSTVPPVRLVVGQSATEQQHITILRSVSAPDLERKLAWQEDRIEFDDTPLAVAIEQVNRYSAVPLSLADDSLRNVRVSGAFSTKEVQVFVRSLENGFGLQVELGPEGHRVSRATPR